MRRKREGGERKDGLGRWLERDKLGQVSPTLCQADWSGGPAVPKIPRNSARASVTWVTLLVRSAVTTTTTTTTRSHRRQPSTDSCTLFQPVSQLVTSHCRSRLHFDFLPHAEHRHLRGPSRLATLPSQTSTTSASRLPSLPALAAVAAAMVHTSKMKVFALPLARLGPKGTEPLVVSELPGYSRPAAARRRL